MRYDLAPMEGLTGALFRLAHCRWFGGVDRYYMPFLSPTQGHAFSQKELREILPQYNQGLEAVPQLLTRQVEDFMWAAGELAAMGYREVNLNLGCPSGTVVAKGKGAGMLDDPQALDRFLEAVFARTPCPISVKTRVGLRDPEEFGPLLEVYNRYPIAELIVHPRVQKDFYRHPVRWETFDAALSVSRNPLGYNGDLVTAADCRDCERRYPSIASIMLGRGLVADPALARKAKGGAGADKAALEAFHQELYEGYCRAFGSRRNAVMRMKELWSYHICLFRDSRRHGKALRKARDPEEFAAAVAAIFRELDLLENTIHWW